MKKLASIVSAAIMWFFVFILIVGFVTNPWDHRISISSDFHIAVWNHDFDSRLVFFNDSEYGPYRGSIITIVHNESQLQANGFGDWFGVYYRHFEEPHAVLWTLMVSTWYPIFFFAMWPFYRWLEKKRNGGLVQSRGMNESHS